MSRTIYNISDTHRGVCRPAVLRRKRQRSDSTVESISTDESDLDIPRELRGPRARSVSLFVPAPDASKPNPDHRLALSTQGVSLQTSSSSNNDEATPDLTPATTHTSAQTKSPTPDAGAFSAYLEDLLHSLDPPASGPPPPEAGTIDPTAIMAAIKQPLALDLDLPELSGEWRKGATGAHEFLTNMGSEGRKALQPRLERAVSVLQTAMSQSVKAAREGERPFADAEATGSAHEMSVSPFPFGLALRGYSPAPGEGSEDGSEAFGLQLEQDLLNTGRSDTAAGDDQSSDDDIPPESLINPGAAPANPASNEWLVNAAREGSVEQYVSPMNLLSPSKDNETHDGNVEDRAPLASTSAAGALKEAAASGETDEFVIPRDQDGDIDIYAIFDSYEHAEATLMANGERCGLPLQVAWAPGQSMYRGEEKRGARLVCIHAGHPGSGAGCGYSVRLSDDSLGKWRLTTSQGEHLSSCYLPKPDRKGKGKARGRPARASQTASPQQKKRKKVRTSYLGAPGSIDRNSLPKIPGESAFSRYRIDYSRGERALSPISSKNAPGPDGKRDPLLPRRQYMRARSGTMSDDSSSPGIVVQASWTPLNPYRSQNNQSSTSISPGQRDKLRKAGTTKAEAIELDDHSDNAARGRAKARRKPRFADADEAMEINSGDDEPDPPRRGDDAEPELPPPLSTNSASFAPQDQAKGRGSAYARKKLPPTPSHRMPTKPFQAHRHRPKSRRSSSLNPGYAWVEEPAFIADALAPASGAAKELSGNHLNGGYWRKLDDTGNIVVEKDDGRALRSKRRRGVQADGLGGKRPVETIVPRRTITLPIDNKEVVGRLPSGGDDYRDPGTGSAPRCLRASARRLRREQQPVRGMRARTRRSNAPPGSPGLSFQSRFAFDHSERDADPYGDDDSPPSPAIAKSALRRPYRSKRAQAAQVRTEAATLRHEIPQKLLGSMLLAYAGFCDLHVLLLARAGYLSVKQLTTEGLLGTKEDFTAFRDQFGKENLKADAIKAQVKAVVVKVVWEVRANAVLEWEAAGMMESDYEDEDNEAELDVDTTALDGPPPLAKAFAPDSPACAKKAVDTQLDAPPIDAASAEPDDDDFDAGILLPPRLPPVHVGAVAEEIAISDVPRQKGAQLPAQQYPPENSPRTSMGSLFNVIDLRDMPEAPTQVAAFGPAAPSESGNAGASEDEEDGPLPRFVFHDYPAIDPDDSEDEFMQAMREIDKQEGRYAANRQGSS